MRKPLLGSASLAKSAAISTVVAAFTLLAGCSTLSRSQSTKHFICLPGLSLERSARNL